MTKINTGLIALAIVAAGFLLRRGQAGPQLQAEALGGSTSIVSTYINAPVTTSTYAPTNISYGGGGGGGTSGPDEFNETSVESIILGRAAAMGDFQPSPFHRASGGIGDMWR